MAQRELTDACLVLEVEQGPCDISSIEMLCREAGKDFVVIGGDGSLKNLPRKSKLVCRDCLVLPQDLESLWRNVRGSPAPNDECHPPQIWFNLFQEFHLLGEQVEPSNSCNVPLRSCEVGYES